MGQLHVCQSTLSLSTLLINLKSLGRAYAPKQDGRLELSR